MVNYSMISRPGKREKTEDSIRMCDRNGQSVFALADGLGGHGGGDMASSCVVNQAVDIFRTGQASADNYLECAFIHAQGCLLQKKKLAGISTEMKSTMVLLQISKDEARWAHIGDSRLYFFEDDSIVERTVDHSVPQMLARAGKIKEKEIRHHPDRNKVLRVLGTPWEGSSYEISESVPLRKGQAFLLCTDGFWEYITEKEMEKALRQSRSVAQWLNKMESIVLKNGENADMDNYSAICVYVEENPEEKAGK